MQVVPYSQLNTALQARIASHTEPEVARVQDWHPYAGELLPLSRPALAVLAIFSIIWRWNDFLWPLIVAQDESKQTLPVAIARFAGEQAIPFDQILAVSVVSIIPVVVLFLILQRQIISGLVRGAVR
ncbi:ABC transporter permease subunit [Nocardia terpenica]|uniref:ABC transporter permease subunit n=1 Tax=Nocardia terpenica TaxID=455432 RepID=UPI0019337563|nr:ABC transporter permease subunit [Nocardia terpenica]